MQKTFFLFALLALLVCRLDAQEEAFEIKEFDQDIAKNIFEEGKLAMVLFFDYNQHKEQFGEFESAAKELQDKYLFCKTNIHEGMGVRLSEYLGVTDNLLPTIYILNVNGRDIKKYRIDKEITAENIKLFASEYTEGKLIPTRKSEEIPETNDQPVKKIVGKNFKDLVLDSTKDVLVKVYAPWCGHCKQMIVAPDYEKVAAKLSHNTNIIIGEYDGTKNENEEISITGFPTLLFFPGNKKDQPITYSASRTEQEMIDFLKENTTFEWIEAKQQEKSEEKTENKQEL